MDRIIEVGEFRYNRAKDIKLHTERGISFKKVIEAYSKRSNLLGTIKNKNYKDQLIMHIMIDNYPCSVPFIPEMDGKMFLKTVYRDRRLFKLYEIKGL